MGHIVYNNIQTTWNIKKQDDQIRSKPLNSKTSFFQTKIKKKHCKEMKQLIAQIKPHYLSNMVKTVMTQRKKRF